MFKVFQSAVIHNCATDWLTKFLGNYWVQQRKHFQRAVSLFGNGKTSKFDGTSIMPSIIDTIVFGKVNHYPVSLEIRRLKQQCQIIDPLGNRPDCKRSL